MLQIRLVLLLYTPLVRSHQSNTQVVLVTDDMGSQAAMEMSSKYTANGYLHGTIALHTGFTLQALKLHVPLCA